MFLNLKQSIKILFFLSIIFFNKNYAQNLVPNPSFETFTSCPLYPGDIYKAVPWQGVNSTTTDYFNACSVDWGVPVSFLNPFQYARTGDAFAGFVALGNSTTNYREYLQVQLDSTLMADSCYFLSFYCNLDNDPSGSVAIKKLGAFLSDTAVSLAGPGTVLQFTPQIVSSTFLPDTANWMRVCGYYYASGGEQFLTIGNFNTDINTDTLHVNGASRSYYLIDDISIEKVQGCDTVGVGISENGIVSCIRIYPNPSNGNMTLECNLEVNEKGILAIYDITGKLLFIYNLEYGAKSQLIDAELEAGIYLYDVIINDRKVHSDKLVVIK